MENSKENMIFISGLKGLTVLNKAQWNQRKPKKMVQFIFFWGGGETSQLFRKYKIHVCLAVDYWIEKEYCKLKKLGQHFQDLPL